VQKSPPESSISEVGRKEENDEKSLFYQLFTRFSPHTAFFPKTVMSELDSGIHEFSISKIVINHTDQPRKKLTNNIRGDNSHNNFNLDRENLICSDLGITVHSLKLEKL